jgi:hypothetical protein
VQVQKVHAARSGLLLIGLLSMEGRGGKDKKKKVIETSEG